MGRMFVTHLEGKFYSCKHCRTHLALCQDIVSKSFHCRHGKAYLFSKVVNVSLGKNEERQMMTGWHTVADIFCVGCGSIVGWKYETAHEKTQKYKEGKSVLERDVVTVWIPVLREIGNMDKDTTFLYCLCRTSLYFLSYKVSGPDGSNYWVSHEAHVGGSDVDDA
ncbi:hypothetical protein Ahy_A07g031907 isoform B [Arachis hypogaea]|nr:hypothetical protein Ahy_A07g031907 isoform B [Arachis hypogaea]